MPSVISAGRLLQLSAPFGAAPRPFGYSMNLDALPLTGDVAPETVWQTQPSVRKVIDFIARAIASTPIKVFRRVSDTDREYVPGHPVARVLALPSPNLTPFRFWHSVLVDWLIFDRFLVLKLNSGEPDRPVDLVRMQAQRVEFLDDGLGRVRAIRLDSGRETLTNPDQWMLDHGYGPMGANGITPMATLQQVLSETNEAVEFRRAVWRNGARTAAVIQRPADAPRWSPEARDRFVSGWREYASGGSRAGGNPLLEDGMTLAKVDAFAPKDTEDLAGRQLNDIEVCSAFHIAPELVGARQGNYSNVAAYAEMLYGPTLGPFFVALEQVVNTMLVRQLDDGVGGELYAEYAVEAKMRGTFEQQAAVLSTAVGAPWLTRSEARARFNLPQLSDTNGLVVPLNVLIGGQASPRDTGSQNTQPAALAALAQFLKRQRNVVMRQRSFDRERWTRELSSDLGPLLGERAPLVAAAVNDSIEAELEQAGPQGAGDVFDRWQRHTSEGAQTC